tara:strand:+ start:360 stop:662 length:303 start_codon:yes stop_codon:yes gene_type:complete
MNYKKHIFICINQRKSNLKESCGLLGLKIRNKFVEELKNKNLNIQVRANKSGCLGACSSGPVIVIYPQGIWYKNVKLDDVLEIINKSIINNKVIERLLLK